MKTSAKEMFRLICANYTKEELLSSNLNGLKGKKKFDEGRMRLIRAGLKGSYDGYSERNC